MTETALVNTQTGEVAPLAVPSATEEIKPNDFQQEIQAMIPTAGTLILTDEQKQILFAPVKDEDVEIRPDGLIYLPWMAYVSRLRDAFGCEWAIIPQGLPQVQGKYIIQGYWLIIQGKLCAWAIGECESRAWTMSWGDTVEGATSNALMRLCKRLGIGLELWQPAFIRRWKAAYAESYQAMVKGEMKTFWKRKDAPKTPPDAQKAAVLPQTQTGAIEPAKTVLDVQKAAVLPQTQNGNSKKKTEWTPAQTEYFKSVQKYCKLAGITTEPERKAWAAEHRANLLDRKRWADITAEDFKLLTDDIDMMIAEKEPEFSESDKDIT